MVDATDGKQGLKWSRVRELFNFDPDTGVFTYKQVPRNTGFKIGDEAGYIRDGKYRMIKIDGRPYYAHRLAWFYMYGVWPAKIIDHINGNKQDNRIANLRNASMSQNKSNGETYANNTSGYKGVVKCGKRWKAQITHNNKVIYLGLHDTKEEAHQAYLLAAKGLQEDFARPS